MAAAARLRLRGGAGAGAEEAEAERAGDGVGGDGVGGDGVGGDGVGGDGVGGDGDAAGMSRRVEGPPRSLPYVIDAATLRAGAAGFRLCRLQHDLQRRAMPRKMPSLAEIASAAGNASARVRA